MRHPTAKVLGSLLLLLFSACGGSGEATSDLADVDAALRAPGSGTLSVLIGFRSGGFAHRAELGAGAQVHAEWADLNAVAAHLPAAAIDALSRNPNVEYIEEDRQVTVSGKPGGLTGGSTGIGDTLDPNPPAYQTTGSVAVSPTGCGPCRPARFGTPTTTGNSTPMPRLAAA